MSVSQLLTSVFCVCVVAELHMESTASVLWKARCERWSCFPFLMLMFIRKACIDEFMISFNVYASVQVHSRHAVCLSPTHVLLLAVKSAKTSMVPQYVRMQVNTIHACIHAVVTINEQRLCCRINCTPHSTSKHDV